MFIAISCISYLYIFVSFFHYGDTRYKISDFDRLCPYLISTYLVSLISYLLLLDDFNAAQVLSQDLGNDDGAVGALVLLHQGREDAGGGQTGAVQGVDELGLAGGFPAEADVAPAGLVIPGVGDGGELLWVKR